MALNILPPSPAPSDCDSLADIDDLDAFLAAQGPLSIFPTPHQQDPRQDCDYAYRDSWAYSIPSIATVPPSCEDAADTFVALLRSSLRQSCMIDDDLDAVHKGLVNADLPIELLALAYAILDQCMENCCETGPLQHVGTGLIVTAGLALADTYLSDRPYHLKTWARLAASERIYSSHDIDETLLGILKTLGWSVHRLCNAATVQAFTSAITTTRAEQQRYDLPKLQTNSTTAHWVYGQLTPAEQSPHPLADAKPAFFLPLL